MGKRLCWSGPGCILGKFRDWSGSGLHFQKIPGPGSEIAELTRSHSGPGQKTRGFEIVPIPGYNHGEPIVVFYSIVNYFAPA